MGLEITNATHARSQAGTTSIINNINGDINRAVKALDGQAYDTLIKTVKNNWAGEACDDFIADLEKKKKNLKANMNGLKAKIESVVNEDFNNFKKAQGNIYKK